MIHGNRINLYFLILFRFVEKRSSDEKKTAMNMCNCLVLSFKYEMLSVFFLNKIN